jgi:hypothetical protein
MLGAFKSMPKGTHFPKPYTITVMFGPPIRTDEFKGMQDDRELCQALTDEVMLAIEKLTRPEHVIEPKVRKEIMKRRKARPLKSFLTKAKDTR